MPLARRINQLMGATIPYFDIYFDEGSADSLIRVDHNTYRIVPERPWVNTWAWYAIRTQKLTGKTPTFLIDKTTRGGALPTDAEILAVWSTTPDTDNWTLFDNVTVGANDIVASHNSPFPPGMIYIAALAMYPFSRVQRKMSEWLVNNLVSDTPSSTQGIIGHATARAATDGSGRICPALPFYAFKVSNGGGNTKNKAILAAYNHPNETPGAYQLEGAVDWLLGGSTWANFLLDWFDFYVYPCVNPQGVWSGHYRTSPQTPNNDNNRLWTTTGTNEAVDAFKASMVTDTGGTVQVGFDYHSAVLSSYGYMSSADHTAGLYAVWLARMKLYNNQFGYSDENIPTSLRNYFSDVLGAPLALTCERGGNKTKTATDTKIQGRQTLQSVANMVAEDYFPHGPGNVGSREFNGLNSRIDWANVADLSSHALTISMWIKIDAFPPPVQNGYLLTMHTAGDTNYGIIVTNSDAYISFLVRNTGTTMNHWCSMYTPQAGWLHVLITWTGNVTDASTAHTYVNGVERSNGNVHGTGTVIPATGSWSIGGRIFDDNRNVDGKMAQVGIWDRVLNDTERADLISGYAPSFIQSGLLFYFAGNTASLTATPGGTGVADGTTLVTGTGNGPGIIYP